MEKNVASMDMISNIWHVVMAQATKNIVWTANGYIHQVLVCGLLEFE